MRLQQTRFGRILSPSVLLLAHCLNLSVEAGESVDSVIVCKLPQRVQDCRSAILGKLILVQAIVIVPTVAGLVGLQNTGQYQIADQCM